MANLDFVKRDFLIKIAKMYYIEGLFQQEIADRMNISRSNVSKMLKTCRDLNIVEIRINDTSSLGILLQKEIKQAFRKLARRYHPDVNPGDGSAEERFKEINEAYEILGDEQKKREYNRLLNWSSYSQRTIIINDTPNDAADLGLINEMFTTSLCV